ncbi:MAG: helix-turn-helix domain-containing protein [Saprospiraceae bacterium]|nr:helix-turn-helix domain-containing protein [Saprospiraceae bacterium]
MENNHHNEKFYTIDAASELLSCNPRVLRSKINTGELKAYKQLKRWFIFHSDLIEFIKNGNSTTQNKNTSNNPSGQ